MKEVTMIRRVLLLAVLAVPVRSHAQPAGAQAEVLFRQGRDLMTAGNVAEACAAFEESQRLEPAVTTLLNLAGCREKNGQLATAWGLFLDAERQTRSTSDDATKQLHDVAEARAKQLEPRVSKLAIDVPQQSQIDGLEILRGAEVIPPVMWNRALPIDGGTYTITARAPGGSPWSAQVTVGAEGDTKTIDIPDLRDLARDLAPPKPVTPPPVVTTPPVRSEHHTTSRSLKAPLIVSAGAAALVGGAIGFELWGESNYSSAKAEMLDQSRRDALSRSANTKRYIAEGLGAAGVAAAGVAVWLFVTHGHRHAARETSSLRVVPTGTGLTVMGSY